MKKLNITKERFEKSNYFKNKYGKLEYVSESGKLFKTDKGRILMFKEYHDSGDPPRKDKNDGACDNLAPGEYGLSREFADGIGTRYVIYQGGRRPGEMYKVKVFGARERRRAEEVLAGLQDGSIDEKNLKYVSENGKLLKFKESFDTYDEFEALGDELEAKYKRCKYAEAELYVDDEGSYTIAVRIDTDHKAESKEMNRFLTQQSRKHHWRLVKEPDIYDPYRERRVDEFYLYVV